MIEKTIPASGEKLPVLGLGTWQTFDVSDSGPAKVQLEEVLKTFSALGGRLLDTSPMYGKAERIVGQLASGLSFYPALFMATKVWTKGQERGIEQMEHSLNLLQTPTLDLMQVHNLVDYQLHLKTLLNWKEEGRIRYIGITHYTTGSYPELMRVMKEHAVDFVQFNYSMQNREAEQSILPFAADQGVAVIINRPFEEGSLFARVKGKALPPWAHELGCQGWGQFFLKYLISHPAVNCVLPATANPEHLRENMAAGQGRLPEAAERKKMADYFDRL